jgi:hypothetical protein
MDKAILKGLRRRLAADVPSPGRFWASRDDTTAADLSAFTKLWFVGEPFFITGVVGSPYAGCFHEPQIWLVTPPGCDWHEELNSAHVPTRYASLREKAIERLRNAQGAVRTRTWQVDFHFQNAVRAQPLGGLSEHKRYCEQGLLHYAELIEARVELADAERIYAAACALHPRPLLRRERSIWPLYASGQGVEVGAETAGLRTFQRVLMWLANQTLPTTYGSFDSFTIHKMQPLSSLPPAETYWGHAATVAAETYGIELTWECGACESEIVCTDGDGGGAPTFTSYRGNGGIGVFMEGVICQECLDNGSCKSCYERDCQPMDRFDPEVLAGVRFICEWCEAELLKAAEVSLTREAERLLDAAEHVEIRFAKRDPAQTQFNCVGAEKLELLICADKYTLPAGTYKIDADGFWKEWERQFAYEADEMRSWLEHGLRFPDMTKHCSELELGAFND